MQQSVDVFYALMKASQVNTNFIDTNVYIKDSRFTFEKECTAFL